MCNKSIFEANKSFINELWSRCPAAIFQKVKGQMTFIVNMGAKKDKQMWGEKVKTGSTPAAKMLLIIVSYL